MNKDCKEYVKLDHANRFLKIHDLNRLKFHHRPIGRWSFPYLILQPRHGLKNLKNAPTGTKKTVGSKWNQKKASMSSTQSLCNTWLMSSGTSQTPNPLGGSCGNSMPCQARHVAHLAHSSAEPLTIFECQPVDVRLQSVTSLTLSCYHTDSYLHPFWDSPLRCEVLEREFVQLFVCSAFCIIVASPNFCSYSNDAPSLSKLASFCDLIGTLSDP